MRTESMAQRLAKQSIPEGLALMDKGYNLGAMRLLTVKAETAPPFQLAPCLEAIATILLRLDETDDAAENFGYAAEKYSMINQTVLGEVMKARMVEAKAGPEEALKEVEAILQKADPEGKIGETPDSKTRQNIARAYHLRADLNMQLGKTEAAVADAQRAISLGWDRVFDGHYLLGQLLLEMGDAEGAEASFSEAVKRNPNFLPAFEALVPLLQAKGESARITLIETLNRAIEIHPRAQLIRAKAFALSESGKDAEALQMLDQYVANPPHEETEALFSSAGTAEAVFLKAKAAVLGDLGRVEEAIAAAQQALAKVPGDEEASAMLNDLNQLQATKTA